MTKFYKLLVLFPVLLFPGLAAASDADIESNVLKYVNIYRQNHKMNTLTANAIIADEARRHSQDMAAHRIGFGHKYFFKRVKRLYAKIPGCYSGAENVAYNYNDSEYLVSQWLTSRGHKRNIRGPYNLSGVGIARDARGKIYYTQMFLRCDIPHENSSARHRR